MSISKRSSDIQVFPWNENFVTGIETIDKQHKVLVYLLNSLALSLGNEAPMIETDQIIAELFKYTDYHFTSEEAIWDSIFEGDNSVARHKESHREFIKELVGIQEDITSGSTHQVRDNLLRFLIHWLAHHILDDDMRMAKAVHAINQGHSVAEAKEISAKAMSGSTRVFIDTLLIMYGDLSTRTLDLLREKSQRTNAENALHQQQQREKIFTDQVMMSIPGLVYVYDENQKLVRWNRFHEEVLGYSAAELQGKPIQELILESEQLQQPTCDIASGELIEFESKVRSKDGKEQTYLLTAIPFLVDNKPGVVGTGIDISQLKAAEQALEREAAETKEALTGTILAVSRAMEARDSYTAGHQQRVAKISVEIARRLKLSEHEIEGLQLGASIHDIGKIAIPTDLLVKPVRLSSIEFELVKTHATAGVNIIGNVRFPWPIPEMIAQHHERLDGSGYPAGLKGDEIGLEVRILAVADVFEAMSSHRPYRPALGIEAAKEELIQNMGVKYDQQVVETLIDLLRENPDRFNA